MADLYSYWIQECSRRDARKQGETVILAQAGEAEKRKSRGESNVIGRLCFAPGTLTKWSTLGVVGIDTARAPGV
jgi:hypothetical protein